MSKITFRADDDLVERLEAFDASKSEVMREALRAYLDGAERISGTGDVETDGPRASDASDAVGDALRDTVDSLIGERLDHAMREREREREREYEPRGPAQDINLNVTVEGAGAVDADRSADVQSGARGTESERKTRESTAEDTSESRCDQCGEIMSNDHVYCPNCGEKSAHRVFCDCGDELRSDWAFCPSCGRRTPAADVLDRT